MKTAHLKTASVHKVDFETLHDNLFSKYKCMTSYI